MFGQPFLNTQRVSAYGVASLQVKIGSGRVLSLNAYNGNAAVRFLHMVDAAALPADGYALGPADFMQWMAAAQSVPKELAWPPEGFVFKNGLFIYTSTTANTKTLGATDLGVTVTYT